MIYKILIFVVFSSVLFGQYNPYTYSLEEKEIAKISSITPASNSIQDIIVDNNLIILGTSRGISISENNGEDWINFYNTAPFGTDGTTAIGYNNGVIWAATGRTTQVEGGSYLPEGTGLKYSVDNGTTWTSIMQPLDDEGDSLITYGINTIRALPVTVAISNITYDIAFTKNTVWIASFAGGLRKSTDMGKTWQRVVLPPDTLNSISPNDTLDFSLQPVAGKFGPESWLNHRVFSVLGVDDSTIYVGTAGGINKSTDNGVSWVKYSHQNQTNPISGNFVVALGKDNSNGSVWAATWKAEDLNEFWAVSFTEDCGNNWKVTLPDEHAHNFGFKYLDNGGSHVFVPTDHGIFRSADKGISWQQPTEIKDNITNISIGTNIYYAMTAEKISVSDYYIWIGSNNGLARLTEGSNDYWTGEWKVYLASDDIENNETYAFPNPFSPSQEKIKIKYTVPDDTEVTIRIMNFDMQLVRVLIQNAGRGIGDHLEYWDGRDEIGEIVKNGVYFYRIDATVFKEPLFGKIMVLR
jgi:photosystem II stability/assembly factor-like uncharacterized protein